MINPFEDREPWEDQWPDFEPITKDNVAVRFRQYNELTEYIKEVGYNYMRGNDIKRFDRAPKKSYYGDDEPGTLKFELTSSGVDFVWTWVTYFRREYDDGDTWEFSLNYDAFTLEESEILALGAKEKEEQLFREKREKEERLKREKEAQQKRDLEYRKQQYESLKKEFEK